MAKLTLYHIAPSSSSIVNWMLELVGGPYLKWLFFGPSCIEPAMIDRAAPRKEKAARGMLCYGDFDTVIDVAAAAVAKAPYLMGDQFTAADVVIGSTLRWGMSFKALP